MRNKIVTHLPSDRRQAPTPGFLPRILMLGCGAGKVDRLSYVVLGLPNSLRSDSF